MARIDHTSSLCERGFRIPPPIPILPLSLPSAAPAAPSRCHRPPSLTHVVVHLPLRASLSSARLATCHSSSNPSAAVYVRAFSPVCGAAVEETWRLRDSRENSVKRGASPACTGRARTCERFRPGRLPRRGRARAWLLHKRDDRLYRIAGSKRRERSRRISRQASLIVVPKANNSLTADYFSYIRSSRLQSRAIRSRERT